MNEQVEIDIASPEARHTHWIEQGWRLHSDGRLREAATLYRRVLRENPAHPDALHLLGLVAKNRGNAARAEKFMRAALRAGGGTVAIYCNNLANLLRLRQGDEARELYRRALDADPNYVDAWLNLASCEELRGNCALAAQTLEDAHARCPDDLRVIEARSAQLLRLHRYADAIPLLKRVLQASPQRADLWLNLGSAYSELGNRGAAIKVLLHLLKLEPDNAGAKMVLSQIFIGCAAPQEAEILLLKAARTDERAFGTLGNVYKDLGYMDLALDCYARTLTSHPTPGDHSNFLYTLLYDPAHDHAEVAEEHKVWAQTYAHPHRPADIQFADDPDPDRPLRIGYVSGHFWDHAVALFSLPMIQNHDRRRFHLYFYSNGAKRDWATDAFRNLATKWHDIQDISDSAAARLVRQDRIDILVDLAGHIGGNRLLLFAHKPAPIQVTYLGYQATTGMDVMDYRLTDAIADPPGVTDSLYVEKLLRLQPSFFTYLPSDYAPAVAPPPVEKNGFITFGCLNNPGKTATAVVELWAHLLKTIPDSRLLLLGPSTQDADPRVAAQFAAQGIESPRVQFVGKRKRLNYLRVYDQIDIALDPFPFSGHTTTCDALWQGLPVVTLAGRTYAGRMSASTLTQAKFPQWIAESPEHYVDIALTLARDPAALAALRQNMRRHLSEAPILDAPGFTTTLEAAYRMIWQRRCANISS
jgi:protein O-GlcNAc transferase